VRRIADSLGGCVAFLVVGLGRRQAGMRDEGVQRRLLDQHLGD
jgi:hypothetical protein